MIGRRPAESALALSIALVAVVLSAAPLPAGAQSYGTELPFVVGTGARSSGLGLAAVTLADDASVQHYNPSGLGYLQWKEFVFYRTTLFDSKSVYHAVSYAHPLMNHGTLAISLLRVDAGGIEERNATNQLLSTDLHNAHTRILLGYARPITGSVAAGINVKLDNQSFGDYSASAAGMDVGFLASRQLPARSFVKTLRAGFAVRNVIEPSLKLDREKVPDPMDVAFGLSALSRFGNVAFVTSFDVLSPRHSPLDFRFGQEVVYDGHFALRAGLDDVTATWGLGARFRQFSLDYAYRSQDLGDNHRISLSVRFGASIPEQRARARERLESQVNTQLAARMAEVERAHVAGALSEADSLASAGACDDAVERFETVLLWDSENADARRGLTRCRYRQAFLLAEKAEAEKSYVEGVFHANQALSFAPGDPAATALIARCNERLMAAENSQALINKLLKKSIDLYAERRFAEALSGFEQVLAAAPNSALATEYADKCRRNMEEAAARQRADAERRARQGDFQGAVTALEAAREYAPDDPHILEALALYKQKRDAAETARAGAGPGGAKAPVEEPAGSAPVDKALDEDYRRGMALFNAGDFDGSIASLHKVWTAQPDYYSVSDLLAKAYIFVGMRYYSENKHVEAIETWQKVLRVDPDNSKAKRYLAKAEEELQKLRGVSRAR